jgi:hypothetical protein
LYRLWVPAVCSAVVAIAYWILSHEGIFVLRGGPLVEVAYCLVVIGVVVWFALVLIDDAMADIPVTGRPGGQIYLGTLPIAFGVALRRFYGTFFLPAAVLAFALGLILTCALIGLLPDQMFESGPFANGAFRSEVVAGAAWLLASATLFATIGLRAALGFHIGFYLGILLAQVTFTYADVRSTVMYWTAVAAVSGLAFAAMNWVLSRRRRHHLQA